MASPCPHMLQAYNPPLSLWGLVEQHVPLSEQEEVKDMLGSHIVDQSLELHGEVEMLLEIWRDMRNEHNEGMKPAALPEPPNQRDRLVQEINFFVENVKEKAKLKGINPDHLLKYHNQNVIDYVSDLSRPGSSVGRSSRSSDGRETPMMMTSPDRVSRVYEVTDEVEAVNDKLNVNDFGKVCSHLRSYLEQEVAQLVNDLEFLQNCLDNEADIRDCITPRTSREPTLTELREERASLEKELLLSDTLTSLPEVQNRAFAASSKMSLPSTPQRADIHPSPPQSRPAPIRANHNIHGKWSAPHEQPAFGESTSGKANPLKACHNIFTKSSSSDTEESPAEPDTMSNYGKLAISPATLSVSRSDSKLHPRLLPDSPQTTAANSPRTTSRGRSHRDEILNPRVQRRQKTLSPSRIRVVNLDSIVDINTDKKDSSLLNNESQYDFTSPVSSNFSMPSSAAPVPDQRIGVRPSSADRFRKMVMGCRDGE